jgi:hypothetical protein
MLEQIHKYPGRKKILNAVEQELVQQILRWAETTQTGDKKELNLGSELMQQWPCYRLTAIAVKGMPANTMTSVFA